MMDLAPEDSLGHYARRLTKEEHNRINTNQSMSDWQRNRLGDEIQIYGYSGIHYRQNNPN